MSKKQPFSKTKAKFVENVTYQVTDKYGKKKFLFQANALGRMLIRKGISDLTKIPSMFRCFTGHYTTEMRIDNLLPTVGLAALAGLFNGVGSVTAFTFIGIGTGTTAAAAADTAIETEIDATCNPSFTNRGGAATVSLETGTVVDDTARLIKTFTCGAFTPAVTESGVLNSNTAGTLGAHQVFSAINLVAADNLQITWDIKMANA